MKEENLQNFRDRLKEMGFVPIDTSIDNNKILVIDINYLTFYRKDGKTEEELKAEFEKEYNCKVIFIDACKQNVQGTYNTQKPIYFI